MKKLRRANKGNPRLSKQSMKYNLLKIATTFMFLMNPVIAAEIHELTLKHGEVSHTEISAKVGDTIKIIHEDDDDLHALYAEDEHHNFDLSTMKHGDHFDLELTHTGTITVRCHEMENMTIVINVTD